MVRADDERPADLHFAVPLDVAGVPANTVCQLALALESLGVRPSLQRGAITGNLSKNEKQRLQVMMRRQPSRQFWVRWDGCSGADARPQTSGTLCADFVTVDHRLGPWASLDLETRRLVMNGRRKLSFSESCRDALVGWGVPTGHCAVIPAGPAWPKAAEGLWNSLLRFLEERDRAVAARSPAPVSQNRVSIIVSTYNRPEILKAFLAAYRSQSLPSHSWEMILVDDASGYAVADLVREHGSGLPLRLLINAKNIGQGRSRNRAIPLATGDVILFTGDDIIPDPNFLSEHLRMHQASGDRQLGILGHIDWHPDVVVSPLMAYITGDGGQQFYYDSLTPGHCAGPDFFYTSNVSVRRSLLVEQEELFSDRFINYGFEDIELGVRLVGGGMRLVYHPQARATHLHPMTDRSIVERQYRVGRSLVILSLMHPGHCDREHRVFLEWLNHVQRELLTDPKVQAAAGELRRLSQGLHDWIDGLSQAWQALGGVVEAFTRSREPAKPRKGRIDDRQRLEKSLYALRLELALRSGMADEWLGVEPGAPNPARDLVHVFLCTAVWRLGELKPLPKSPRSQLEGRRALHLARHLRRHPRLSPLWACLNGLPGFSTFHQLTRNLLRRAP